MVPYGSNPEGEKDRSQTILPWVLWILMGAVASLWSPLVGAGMMGYGFGLALKGKPEGFQRILPWLVGLVGIAAGGLLARATVVEYLSSAVVWALSGAAAWTVVRRGGTFGSNAAVIAVATVAYLAIDVVMALVAGVDPMALAQSQVQQTVAAATQSYGLEMAAQLRSLTGLLELLWPFPYFLLAAILTAIAHGCARLAAPRLQGDNPQPWALSSFDAPLWSMVVLTLCAVAVAVAPLCGTWSRGVLMVGVNGLMAVRIIFMLQGFAVISWFFRTRRLGCLFRFVVLFLAVDLEVSFFVVSVLGLVDFWANFRHLPRRSRTDATGPEK